MIDRRTMVCFLLGLASTGILSCSVLPEQEAKTGQLSGHVADATGAIIQRASVFVRRTDPPEEEVKLQAHTDGHGDFKVTLPEGGYDILVTSPGFASKLQTVPVLAGKSKTVRFKLGPLDCSFPGINCDAVSVR